MDKRIMGLFRFDDKGISVNAVFRRFQNGCSFIDFSRSFQCGKNFFRCYFFPVGEGQVFLQCNFPGKRIELFEFFCQPRFRFETFSYFK